MSSPNFLREAAIYLSAAVLAVPLFKRLGLGSVLGYLLAAERGNTEGNRTCSGFLSGG